MQTNNDIYRKNETVGHMFLHSCLGRLVIVAIICAILAGIASITVPDDKRVEEEVTASIKACIKENYATKCDKIDDAVRNLAAVFSTPDTTDCAKYMKDFDLYNKIETEQHALYSTARIRNNLSPDGIRVGIGFLGMVIPTVNFSDMILRVGPVRKDYNQRIINNAYSTDDLGNNPDFGDTYNTYQGGGSGE